MAEIKAANGQSVTEEMLNSWCQALDEDRWPAGEVSVGPVVSGRPPLSAEGSAVVSVKVPLAMKRAIEVNARNDGMSTSEYVRSILAEGLIKTA